MFDRVLNLPLHMFATKGDMSAVPCQEIFFITAQQVVKNTGFLLAITLINLFPILHIYT